MKLYLVSRVNDNTKRFSLILLRNFTANSSARNSSFFFYKSIRILYDKLYRLIAVSRASVFLVSGVFFFFRSYVAKMMEYFNFFMFAMLQSRNESDFQFFIFFDPLLKLSKWSGMIYNFCRYETVQF